MVKKVSSRKKRVINHLGKVSMALLSASLLIAPSSALASDTAAEVMGSEGGKQALNAL